MKLNLPFYSQYSELVESEWQVRSCAILCLKIVMEFMGVENVSISELIKEGIAISQDLTKKGKQQSGYTNDFGWGHDLLVMLFRNKGIISYRQEFRSLDEKNATEFINFGINKIAKSIQAGFPVLASVFKDVNNPRISGHMVVISGIEEDDGGIRGFSISDPEEKNEAEGKNKLVDIRIFKKVWKKLAIFVEK